MIHTLLFTDQTRCYDESGIEIPCGGSGQDAEFKTDHRISAERFQLMTDVVLDSLTGLTWCRNANLADFPLDWKAAHDFINEMNGVWAFGRSDWRLPSRRELFTLISHEVFNPVLICTGRLFRKDWLRSHQIGITAVSSFRMNGHP